LVNRTSAPLFCTFSLIDALFATAPTFFQEVMLDRLPPHTIEPQTIEPQAMPVGGVYDKLPEAARNW
jgi:hypothetical protein